MTCLDALKTHRRDQFIEWMKGLLATPFVLLSQPTAINASDKPAVEAMAHNAHARYSQVLKDVEELISDHIVHQKTHDISFPSKLKLLVPSVGTFFTPLPLQDAFAFQDMKRRISSRRFVAPSFNDIRLILNTAQAMSLVRGGRLELVTFDGDVTLYDDGESLHPSNPCIPRILSLLRKGTRIAIVTAAGYTDAEKYHERLYGLLEAMASESLPSPSTAAAPIATPRAPFEDQLVVMGGEANFLFAFAPSHPARLKPVPPENWRLPEMHAWTEPDIQRLLDVADGALRHCVECLDMGNVAIMRKERAVGIYPVEKGARLARERLEETVLVVQRVVETSEVGRRIPFCAFNGGNDVFVDIGDKSWGVRACQEYFGHIPGERSLHIGDQFLSAGANDFKARQASTTCWIASPAETVALLDEIAQFDADELARKGADGV